MQNLDKIIENYCKITGRPVATMTVTEYLMFYEHVCRGNFINPCNVSENISKEIEQNHNSQEVLAKQEVENTEIKTTPIMKKQPATVSVQKVEEKAISENNRINPKAEMLAFLNGFAG